MLPIAKVRELVKQKWDKGFTLFEVLVAGLIAILFFLLVLQATSIGAFSKARTQEATQVLGWIQKDLEQVRYVASNYQITKLTSNVSMGTASVNVGSVEDFKNGDTIRFSGTQPDETDYTIYAAPTGNQIPIAPALTAPHNQDDIIAVRSSLAATLSYPALVGSKSISVSSTAPFKEGAEIAIGDPVTVSGGNNNGKQNCNGNHYGNNKCSDSGTTSDELYTIKKTTATTLELKDALKSAKSLNSPISLVRCTAQNQDTGLADGLRDKLVGSNQMGSTSQITLDKSKTISSTGKQFTVQRTMTILDIPPFNLLQISYGVDPPLGTPSPIDGFVTRLLPEVAFYCQ
jgi:type II secretory pathway pseudopilin PulG